MKKEKKKRIMSEKWNFLGRERKLFEKSGICKDWREYLEIKWGGMRMKRGEKMSGIWGDFEGEESENDQITLEI